MTVRKNSKPNRKNWTEKIYSKLKKQYTVGNQNYMLLFVFVPPTLKKRDHIGFSLSACLSVRTCIQISFLSYDLVWIPHQKIADHFFVCELFPIVALCPFKGSE